MRSVAIELTSLFAKITAKRFKSYCGGKSSYPNFSTLLNRVSSSHRTKLLYNLKMKRNSSGLDIQVKIEGNCMLTSHVHRKTAILFHHPASTTSPYHISRLRLRISSISWTTEHCARRICPKHHTPLCNELHRQSWGRALGTRWRTVDRKLATDVDQMTN